jgi:hypothetical protein
MKLTDGTMNHALSMLLPALVLAGCGTTPAPCACDSGVCDAAGACQPPEPSEAHCLDLLVVQRKVEPGCGVFLDATIGNDEAPGTWEKPVLTFGRAVELARRGRRRIIAANLSPAGTDWGTGFELPSGVDLWGGFFNTYNRGWIYYTDPAVHDPDDKVDRRAFIRPPIGLPPLTIVPDTDPPGNDDGVSTLGDLRLVAEGYNEVYESSYGLVVKRGAAVELLRTRAQAGYARWGWDGASPGATPSLDGQSGFPGAPGCTADVVPGGEPIVQVCDGVETTGGKGGDGRATFGSNGGDGQPLPVPNPTRSGLGGAGDSSGTCQDGEDGLTGEPGENGAGGKGIGRITETGYYGLFGESRAE